MKKIAVVIVNWNGAKYLKDCLDSFNIQTFSNFDIYLVDNNSTDNSLEIVKNNKNIKVIENKENLGFAKGNNTAISKALEAGYEYIALINPDTVLDPKALEKLYSTIDADPKIGAAQSKVMLFDSELINTAGNDLHYLGFSYCGDYKKPDHPVRSGAVTAASGAAVILRSLALQKVGLLDEDFFMYLEDTDLSWRIWEAGYTVWVAPDSIIWHKYNFSRNKNKFYLTERNRLIFVLKNYDLRTIIVLFPAFLVTELLMLIYSLFGGWLGLKFRGYTDIARIRGGIMKKRREIKSTKKISDHQLKYRWAQALHFEEVTNPLFIPLNIFFRLYWLLFGWLV